MNTDILMITFLLLMTLYCFYGLKKSKLTIPVETIPIKPLDKFIVWYLVIDKIFPQPTIHVKLCLYNSRTCDTFLYRGYYENGNWYTYFGRLISGVETVVKWRYLLVGDQDRDYQKGVNK